MSSTPCSPDPQPDDTAVDVGVVIVTYCSEQDVDALSESLPLGLEGVDWRVVAVDNASTDRTVERLEQHGIHVISMPHNAGYAAAINVGIRHFANARSILVLNADVALARDSVATMLAALRDDPRVGIVVPQVRSFDGELTFNQRRDPSLTRALAPALIGGDRAMRLRLSEIVTDPQRYLTPRDVEWAVGAIYLIGKTCADAVGPWDESFFLYSEETDFCERARRAGFVVRYVSDAIAYHEGGGGVHQPHLRSMMVVNRVRHYRRHHSLGSSWIFYAAILLNEKLRSLAGNTAATSAERALLHPSLRPSEMKCSDSLLPR
jgi:N-acetylglucosaminyl-diphospho-decaprenol L-rhamnosyltransferase